ncbi:MAG: sensor histidine kinase [Thermocrispum sp.]
MKPFDLVLAGALVVIGTVGTIGTDQITAVDTPVDALAIGMMLLSAATTALRRRWPLPVLAVVTAITATFLALGYPYGPIWGPFVVAVYTVAAYRPLATSVPAAVACVPAVLIHLFTHNAAIPGLLGVIPGTAWVVLPFAIGVTVRLTREARERAQAESVRDRVYDERLRIAQEVHDVVGHGLAAIKMQADVALHLLAKKPEQAQESLAAISRTATEALDEVRGTLVIVRQQDTDRAPTPGLNRLEDLRQRMSQAGMQVDMVTTGTPRALPDAVDLAGYRVVQESLTNVLRHAARKTASVRVAYDAGAVIIAVSNPDSSNGSAGSAGSAPGAGGFGIQGMAERVGALGGEFSAGPTDDGRFEVRASLPTGEQR